METYTYTINQTGLMEIKTLLLTYGKSIYLPQQKILSVAQEVNLSLRQGQGAQFTLAHFESKNGLTIQCHITDTGLDKTKIDVLDVQGAIGN
ncbi:hypothetical protein [Neisseria sp. Ec49-e6-T10]|uniref:hypothetical protein n=1 Tax=Neisseria sp. Ec49-e6-T10 TaxID=3140744 RepID=UPI003EB71F79